MITILLSFLLSMSTVLADSREEADLLLQKFQAQTRLTTRLDHFSKEFLGLPYGKNGPLGEGPEGRFDQDPLYRFDTFDCTTYVETIMALSFSRTVTEFETELNHIRYEDGVVDYLKRNHFTDLQWIPFNIKQGYLKDITLQLYSGSEVKLAEALINFPAWIRSHKLEQIVIPYASLEERESRLEELHQRAQEFVPQIARIPYVEVNFLLASPQLLNRIPSGTLVNFVRPNLDLTQVNGTHQNISHQGLLFRVKNVLYLRHAAVGKKVEQVPFLEYLEIFRNHVTLKGIHLMQITAQGL